MSFLPDGRINLCRGRHWLLERDLTNVLAAFMA